MMREQDGGGSMLGISLVHERTGAGTGPGVLQKTDISQAACGKDFEDSGFVHSAGCCLRG
jgi:hypothetical protein